MKKLNKVLSLFLVFVFVLGIASSYTLSANAVNYIVTINVKNDQTEARKMLAMVNDFRTGTEAWAWNETNTEQVYVTGLEELKYDYDLERIAMQRAAEIALYFDHKRPNGTMCYTYTYNNCETYGENIAIGYNQMFKAEEAFSGWREDNDYYAGQGHRRNMLEKFKSIGIAHATYGNVQCWVQEFSWKNPVSPETTPDDANQDVDIEINSEYLTQVNNSASLEELKVVEGEEISLPGVSSSILLTETSWPGIWECNVIPKDINWQIEDTTIASIENDKIKGLTIGETKITANILGKDLEVKLTVEENIEENSLKRAKITLDKEKYEYTGQNVVPVITVIHGEKTLVEGTDYDVSIINNIDIGKATVTISGKGEYVDSVNKEFEIYCPHTETEVKSEDVHPVTCTEDGYHIDRTYCKKCGETLSETKVVDEAFTGHNLELVSTKKASLSEDGLITKKCSKCDNEVTETIYRPTKFTLSKTSYTYNGKVQKPTVTVKDSKGKTIDKSRFTVTYSKGCKYVGTYTVTIKFKGNYSGTKKVTYKINPKGTSISKLTAGVKRFTAKWKKQTTQTTGYEIIYSTDSNFNKDKKYAKMTSNKVTSKTVKKLKAKKKYYVKIRTYKTVSGKKYFSSWSKVKYIKTK